MIRCHITIAAITFYMIAMAIADDIAKRPLVLEKVFLQHLNCKYEYPKSIKKIEHMSGGVRIMRFNSQLVQYFCPAETEKEINAEKNELWSKCVFGSKKLRNTCEKEIQPIAKKASDKNNSHIDCGMGDNEGKLYNIGYQYCFTSDETISTPSLTRKKAPEEDVKFKSNFLNIMDLCYDHNKKRTLYVTHKLYSPKIFQSESMDELSWKTEWKIDDYGIFQDDFKNMETTIENYLSTIEGKVPLTKTPLAWPGDMAFASGKKAFYHYSNIVLTPPTVSDLMEIITNYIRKTAIDKNLGEITIHSGGYYSTRGEDYNSYSEEIKPYAPSHLWHIVLNKDKTSGIAMILHTSIDFTSYSRKNICYQSICFANGWVETVNIPPPEFRGYFYCCSVTETVNELNLTLNEKDLDKMKVLKLN